MKLCEYDINLSNIGEKASHDLVAGNKNKKSFAVVLLLSAFLMQDVLWYFL